MNPQKLLATLALSVPLASAGDAQTSARPHGSLEWLGGPTAIVAHGNVRVLTDPMLGPRGPDAFVLPRHPSTGEPDAHIARHTATPHADLGGLSAVLLSHTHADHFDARARELLNKSLPIVVPPPQAALVRAAGFTDVRPLDWGETLTLESQGTTLSVTAVPAHHAYDPDTDRKSGRVNGYVLTWSGTGGSYRVYWTGDAILSEEMKTLRATRGPIDLLLPHLGAVGSDGDRGQKTLNAEQALTLVRLVEPALVIPIHHTTFGHYREPIEALVQRAEEAGLGTRFRFPTEGKSLPLP